MMQLLSETFNKIVAVDFVVDCRFNLKDLADIENLIDTDD